MPIFLSSGHNHSSTLHAYLVQAGFRFTLVDMSILFYVHKFWDAVEVLFVMGGRALLYTAMYSLGP